MRVAWKTSADKPKHMEVIYSVNMTLQRGLSVAVERSVQYLPNQGGHGWHHTAKLEGLKPGTAYQYRIVCDGVTSRYRTFRTADAGRSEATFLVLGDMGFSDNGEAVASRMRMEALKASADVVLHAGDVGYADDSFLHFPCTGEFCYEAVYDGYMEWIENVTDGKPYMVAVGNHESECHSPACQASSGIKKSLSNFSAYNARWAMPSKESGGVANMWYSFDYASVHFVVVNTETDFPDAPEADFGDAGGTLGAPAGHFAADGAYVKWLEADLKEAQTKRGERPWIVAMGHRPWFQRNGTRRDDAESVRKAHAELFEKYGVNLYLTGHIHSYHRLLPINGNHAVPTIVTGGAGCDEFSSDKRHTGEWDEHGRNSLWDFRYYNKDTQIGMLRASKKTLSFSAIASSTGTIFDVLTLKAPDPDPLTYV
eukprot:CAMPEP_0172881544 /NCGR_PEP_ID=MMETSP1075-20121228/117750_1 /TAXON_ID=2916 /ORGANISM="Ceratium fusus, Strain PA161109" /LENGTH=424 /DNA_ID=CAMNT_0013734005 /DNA_START=252 /DNA_END=1526 /DNA_ORIENTATION=+